MQDALDIPIRFAERYTGWQRLAYTCRRFLGQCLVSIPLHRWSQPPELPAGWRRKVRVRWCETILPFGNLYLRLQGAPSEVLPARHWLKRESVVAAALGRDINTHPNLRALDMRLLRGECLREILLGSSSLEEKLESLRLAARALRQLHGVSIREREGDTQPLSHGDATCNNVIVDQETRVAAWIDFDTRHRADLSTPERHADDLRSFLLSSAGCLPEQADADCVARVFAGYGDEAISQQLRRSLLGQRRPIVFQIAQAPLSFARFQRLRQLVVSPG
jgi:tRNA A-37 threonylcarbamoyl transferase component Bud32